MSEKMDRQGARTAADLERKYQFGKKFQELMGIAEDLRGAISVVESGLQDVILNEETNIRRTSSEIVMDALKTYVTNGELGKFETTLKSEFEQTASDASFNFYKETIEGQIQDVEGDVGSVNETLEKHFVFGESGLTIKAGETEMKIRIDNNVIAFYKGDIDENNLEKNRFGWWDGVNFHTGNIVIKVEERAQFGNFAFVPRSNGSLDFLKVGG